MDALAVLTVNRKLPSCVISIQQGAVWLSGKDEAPMEVSVPFRATWKAETVPLFVPPCALETKSWLDLVGRNSLPKGPGPCAAKGEPGAGGSRPSPRTTKLSIRQVLGS